VSGEPTFRYGHGDGRLNAALDLQGRAHLAADGGGNVIQAQFELRHQTAHPIATFRSRHCWFKGAPCRSYGSIDAFRRAGRHTADDLLGRGVGHTDGAGPIRLNPLAVEVQACPVVTIHDGPFGVDRSSGHNTMLARTTRRLSAASKAASMSSSGNDVVTRRSRGRVSRWEDRKNRA
jgi:hypothetical protein